VFAEVHQHHRQHFQDACFAYDCESRASNEAAGGTEAFAHHASANACLRRAEVRQILPD
jgi:hypothetical protein